MNQSGALVIEAQKVGRDTMLSQIVQLVAEAQRSRAPIQRLADQVSGWFVPAVIVVAVLAFAAWAIWGPEPRFSYGLVAAVGGADHRLPLRARARHADVDHGRRRARRAGGRPDQECRGAGAHGEGRHARRRQDRHADRGQAGRDGASCRPPGFTEAEVLRLAASVERASEHPLAVAIVAAAEAQGLATSPVDRLRFARRQGRPRHGRRQAHRARQCQVPGRARHRRRPARERGRESAAGWRHGDLRRRRRQGGGRHRHRRPREGVDARSARGPQGGGSPRGHADGRQLDDRESCRAPSRDRRGRGRGPARAEERRSCRRTRPRARSSRWPATA